VAEEMPGRAGWTRNATFFSVGAKELTVRKRTNNGRHSMFASEGGDVLGWLNGSPFIL
jgi:hypothetical protein